MTTPRHKIVLFGISRIRCKCDWVYHQAVLKGTKTERLQDSLLDAYNAHIVNQKDIGRLE